MRFLIFYTRYEWRRKPQRMAAMVLLVGILLFCITTLAILLSSQMAAREAASGEMMDVREGHPFSSAAFVMILAAHVLLALVGTAVMTSAKLRADRDEYEILRGLGVGRGRLMLLQLAENGLAFLLSAASAIPLSVGMMSLFCQLISDKVGYDVLIFTFPGRIVVISCILILSAELLGTVLACRRREQDIIKPFGEWKTQLPTMVAFRRLYRRRSPHSVRRDRGMLTGIWLLPLIYGMVALTLAPLPDPMYDCTVTVRDGGEAIPESMVADLRRMEGVTVCDTVRGHREEGEYSAAKLAFDEAFRESGIAATVAHPALSDYDVYDAYHTTRRISAEYAAKQALFGLMAGLLLAAGMLLASALLSASVEEYRSELEVLWELGVDRREISGFLSHEVLGRLVPGGVMACMLAAVAFAIGEAEGGGSLPLWELCAAAVGYAALLTGFGCLTVRAVRRQFWRGQEGRGKNEDHL